MPSALRVYAPVDEDNRQAEYSAAEVPVRLADLLPLVALAHRQNYLWLKDFLEDEVLITDDLADVLHAFRYTRPSA